MHPPTRDPSAAPAAPARSTRVNEIDLLRFLAAMAVVFFHYAFRGYAADDRSVMPYEMLAPLSKYGYLGVELFFMISGFVILMTASRGDLRSFTISRVVRLYPAFWAGCTLTFLAILWLGGDRYSAGLPQYLVNMTMLSGFVGVPSIDGVYWSLFIEMQFYVLVAAVIAIGRIGQAQWFLVAWLLATAALALFPVGPLRTLLIADYAMYFIAGAACFLIWSQGPTLTRHAMVGASLLLAWHQSLSGLDRFHAHFGSALDPVVVGAIVALFFAVMLLVAHRRMGLLGQRRWLLVGALTYPLYLIHQNIGFMLFNAGYPAVNRHLLFWGVIALMLALSYVLHAVVERRAARALKRFSEAAWDLPVNLLAQWRARRGAGAPAPVARAPVARVPVARVPVARDQPAD